MNQYIALLRGVNVGGKNKISMPQLKAAWELAGFSDVSTYINSGNVLFSSEENDIPVLQYRCRQILSGAFGLDISVAILTPGALSQALRCAPAWWDHDPEIKHNMIVVIPPANAQEMISTVGETKPEYEQIAHHGQIIFWSAPLKTFSRTRWSKIVSSSAYLSVTIRNANTAKKLALLAGKGEGNL